MSQILKQRYGTGDRTIIHHIDWLKTGMGAKTVKFDIGAGGLPPDVNWEDKSAAVALIKDKAAKSLASLLVWGDNDNWDKRRPSLIVTDYLAALMIDRCADDEREIPRGSSYTMKEFAALVARMTLHFELYNLWSVYTVEGRLLFSGIKMNDRTYSNFFSTYQRQMLNDLSDLTDLVNEDIARYKFELDKDDLTHDAL
ncbi:hypothetical protein [Psychrobacter sp. BF1]|uniref:hypothetical protein n=1 Tax=Psychrobacter sp. BF1 TaxID=2821147 RepID=UPI001C4E0BC0|nr:hypothetical protein [Psychrobacter sp. BF1]